MIEVQPTGNTPLKPNGSIKVSVMNNCRETWRMERGAWRCQFAGDADGVPPGIYHLNEFKDPTRMVNPQTYRGPLVYVDDYYVFQWGTQLDGKAILVRHSVGLFTQSPVVGKRYEMSYHATVGKTAKAL